MANGKIAESKAKDKYYKLAKAGKGDPKQAKKIDEANKDYEKRVMTLKQVFKFPYSIFILF